LGIGEGGLGPISNTKSPIPNPQSPLSQKNEIRKVNIKKLKNI
jgi:hypothetical protein